MNTLNTAIVVGLVIVAFCGVARADFISYRDAVKQCGMEWKAKAEKPAKGEGRAAWNAFRGECVIRQGYVKGLKAPKVSDPT